MHGGSLRVLKGGEGHRREGYRATWLDLCKQGEMDYRRGKTIVALRLVGAICRLSKDVVTTRGCLDSSGLSSSSSRRLLRQTQVCKNTNSI